ncbi:cation-transporting P-type ATPase [soil metagenome]
MSEIEDRPQVTEQAPSWMVMLTSEVEERLSTRGEGLSPAEVDDRYALVGPNLLAEAERPGVWSQILHQFRSPLVYILLVATVVTLAIEEYVDAGVIFAVLALNAAIGFFQERKAENAVRALMGLVAPKAHVIRSGRESVVESGGLVPGDVVLLESGQRVPADLRMFSTTALKVDESLLTGESVPVSKGADPLPETVQVGDQENMAFTGSVVTSGRGRGYVVATGADTELGRIATQIREEKEPATPLQLRMARFAKVVGVVVAVASSVSILLGIWRGGEPSEMFLVGVAIAVSAIPEGLPVVFTITLAVGVQRMARRKAIIRRLPAVETLGSITAIGSDKTGTLTANRMTVQEIWWDGRKLVAEDAVPDSEVLRRTLLAGVLANEADFDPDGESGSDVAGDPTEIALLVAAEIMGVEPAEERLRWDSNREIPFEPERRFAGSHRRNGDVEALFVKGAPERVLGMCRDMASDEDNVKPLDRDQIEAAVADMAAGGLRVLAMAYRSGAPVEGDIDNPAGLTFLGIQGMMDPPREGVVEAIAGCQRSGIRVVMITGDHADTARSIAADLGIAGREAPVVTGQEIESIDDEGLQRVAGRVSVFARVSPEHKLRVVKALQSMDHVVAVTGDGVNDALALKVADVGVAMGVSGTDVAREASDMVLADDNFVSIYEAVRQGRITFDNLRKVTFFLISSGAAEIFAILTAVAAGWPLPMLPAQILWLNLVTNGVQDVALAFEPEEPGVIDRKPRLRSEGIISRLLWQRTLLTGAVMAIGTLAMFRWTLDTTGSLTQAQTVALTTMVIFQAFHAGNARSENVSALRISPFSNRFLIIAVLGAVALHVAALYVPFTQFVLRVEPIPVSTWVPMILVALTVVVVVEADKWLRARLEGS